MVIRRYILWEVLKSFLLIVGVTTLIFTLGGGAKEGIRRNLPPYLIFQLLPFVLPEMLRFTIPGCLLFAVCSVFGRVSATNEITALKSAGVHPWKVVWPVLAFAVLLSLGSYVLYDVCAGWGRPGLQRAFVQSVEQVAYGVLKSEKSFRSNRLSINVKGVEGRKLLRPIILLEGSENRPAVSLKAQEAELETDQDEGLLRIVARSGQLEVEGQAKLAFEDAIEQAIPFEKPAGSDPNTASPAWLTTNQVPAQIAREREIVAQLERQRIAVWSLGEEEPDYHAQRRKNHQLRLFRLQTEVPRRLSVGFSVLCFALLGIPVALHWRAQDNVTVFFLCFLPILLLYYPLLVVGEYVSTKGMLPPSSIWLPDAVIAVVGAVLMKKAFRY